MIIGSPNSRTHTLSNRLRGHSCLAQSTALTEQFYKEQLKSKYEYNGRGMDRYQREVMVSIDKAAEEERVEKRRRDRELKNQIYLENRKLQESRHRTLQSNKMREQLDEQDRILKAHRELEEERQRAINHKINLRNSQSKALDQQIQDNFTPEIPKNALPSLSSHRIKKFHSEPETEFKKMVIDNVKKELDRQIETKQNRLKWERKEIIEDRRRASMIDLMEKHKDLETKAKKNKEQMQMRVELEKQINHRQSLQTPKKSNVTKSLAFLGRSTNLPDYFLTMGSKGRGFFSPYNQPSKPLW